MFSVRSMKESTTAREGSNVQGDVDGVRKTGMGNGGWYILLCAGKCGRMLRKNIFIAEKGLGQTRSGNTAARYWKLF